MLAKDGDVQTKNGSLRTFSSFCYSNFKASSGTAHYNHYDVCVVIQFCLNGNLVLNVFHKVQNRL